MDNIVEIDLRKILKIIRKNILIIVISTFVCGLGAFVVSKFVMPQLYQATTTLIVNRNLSEENKDEYANSPYAVSDLEYFRKIASTYMEILTSKTILNQVIEQFDLDIKYEDYLKDYIEVEILNNTEVIQVNILDENPDRAMKICNTIPSLFEEEVIRITKVAGIEVIDKASLPEEVEKPNLVIFTLVGLVGGFALGLMIVFFKQILDNKIKSKEDVESKLRVTLLGQIPKIKDMKDKVILADDNLNMDAVESFLKIRTNLEFSNIDNKNNVIVFTSTHKGEGKSTTICNNSVFFSRLENKKVLLVDCDLREPKVHKIMDIDNKNGLVELLKGKNEFDDVVQKINDNLDVITAGQKIINQVDILSSEKMKHFISDVRGRYDYVFVDTPPVGVFADASILSKISDGVVFIVGYNEVDLDEAVQAREILDKADVKIIGSILTKVKVNSSDYGYYYSYGEKRKHKKFNFRKGQA